MSYIPSPDVVANGCLPTVELLQDVKDRLVQQLNEQFCTNSPYRVVPFGSLVRGDATRRSDIDLCFALALTGEEWKVQAERNRVTPTIFASGVDELLKSLIDEAGVTVEANLVDCVSRADDARIAFYSIRSSPTTYDHFGFFARDTRIPKEQRDLYASIQREIAKFSQTGRAARERDLRLYLERCRARHIKFSNIQSVMQFGEIENEGYHILRKLAGLAKTFQNGDGKREIRNCFANARVPFFVELLSHFDPVLQFSCDIEDAITECLGIPDKRGEYEVFLETRVGPMVREADEIIQLVSRHIHAGTLLDAVDDYDREGISDVIVPGQFLDRVLEWIVKGDDCFTVSWVLVGNEVILSRPYTTYCTGMPVDKYTREPIKRGIGWSDKHWWPKTINRCRMNGHGTYEIDLRRSPHTLTQEHAFRENNGTEELLERALSTTRAKLLELLAPLNVVYVESPPKSKPISM